MNGFCSSPLPGVACQGDECSKLKENISQCEREASKCSQNLSLILGNAQQPKWRGADEMGTFGNFILIVLKASTIFSEAT